MELRLYTTVLLFVATTGLAGAVNLLPNGSFNNASQITGWTAAGASISWSNDDATGDATSGSLQLDINVAAGNAISTCFAVQSAAAYTYGGQSRAIAGSPSNAFVCSSYDTTNCTGQATVLPGPIVAESTSWPAATSGGGTLSNTAKSVQCNVGVSNGFPPPTLASARFDTLFFDSTLATPVTLQSFSVE